MGTFNGHIAKRIDLTLDGFLEAKTELKDGVL